MKRWPSGIRTRLTLLYGGAFFLAGAVLVALMLLYLKHALDGQVASRLDAIQELHQASPTHLPPEELHALIAGFRQDRDHVLRAMLVASLISLVLIGIAATGFGWLMAGRALRPLQHITGTARRVAERSLHERIALAGPQDEIKDLADTFDDMLERLDRSFDSQRRFVANASHELRTPLTLNRTLLEVTLDDPDTSPRERQLSTTLLAINQRHERLIDGLLTLAGSEQNLTAAISVDLADIAAHGSLQAGDAAQHNGVELRTHLNTATAIGDPVLLERLIHNLIDNAIRYNLPEGGHITVTTEASDGFACLTVDNTGAVIPSYEIPALFEPFRRLSTSERIGDNGRGAGLGLSIVQAVARAHGGDVHASPREGGGLNIWVRIPAAPRP